MKLRYLLALLLLLLPACTDSGAMPMTMLSGSVSSAGCTGCNSSNDSAVWENPNVRDDASSSASWRAIQFTTSETLCVTGIVMNVADSTDDTITCEVYTDSANEPDAIVGAGFTGLLDEIPDGYADTECLFAATQTLSAGTYWMVAKPSDTIGWGKDLDGVGLSLYSTDSGSNWGASSYKLIFDLWGCTQP